jgi:peptidoglycan/LPS O-acetylase OafA/YrhL
MIFRRKPVELTPQLCATLDFLRWTSALAVLIGHVRIFLFPPLESIAHAGVGLKAFYLVTGFGNQAVMLFFVLSGFLVGGRAVEKLSQGTFRMGDYLADRISRLYPVLIASLVLTAVLDTAGIGWLHDANRYETDFPMLRGLVNYDLRQQFSLGTFLANLFMLQGIATLPFGTNGPLWSLSMEFWYYILFPLLLLPFFQGCAKLRWKSIGFLVPVLVLLAVNGPDYYALFLVWLLGVAARRVSFSFRNSTMAFVLLLIALMNSRIGAGSGYVRNLLVGVGTTVVVIAVLNGGWGITCGAALSKRMANFSYTLSLPSGLERRSLWEVVDFA